MVTRKVCKQKKNFTLKIRLKDVRMFTFFMVLILAFSLSAVYYDVQGSMLNSSLQIANQEHNYYLKSSFYSGKDNTNSFENMSNQLQDNYTLPITFNSSDRQVPRNYCYQQLIELNRASIPEINTNFSNFYFSYSNGSKIYAWIMNVTGEMANIWLRLKFQPSFTIYINIGPKNLSLFGNSSFLGYGVLFFNAPLVFGNSTSSNAWDFSGTSLPNGFVNSGTNYTVDNGLYISGGTGHYASIYIPGTYANNTGILTDMQISSNGYSGMIQRFYYMDNGTRTYSANLWRLRAGDFIFVSENGGQTNHTRISNYGYNVIGMNNSLNTNMAYGTFNNLLFSEPNTPKANASYFSDFTYALGNAYNEQYANYSWVIIRTLPPSNIMPVYSLGIIQKTYTVLFISENLPNTATWFINITSNLSMKTFSSIKPRFAIDLPNGTYLYAIGNSSLYYPVYSKGTFNVNGRAMIIHIEFNEFGFLNVISIPWSSILLINGKAVSFSEWIYDDKGFLQSGIYNGSLLPGNYTIKIEENGYYNYSENVSLSSGKLLSISVTLSPITSSFRYSYITIPIIIAAAFSLIFVFVLEFRKNSSEK